MTNEERARELVNRLDLWVQANHTFSSKDHNPDFWLVGALTSTLDEADARGYARGIEDAAQFCWEEHNTFDGSKSADYGDAWQLCSHELYKKIRALVEGKSE